MQKTPGKTSADREKYWTQVIEDARKYPGGISQYCRDKKVSKDNYYQWFKRLRPAHPEWDKITQPKKKPEASEPKPEIQVSQSGRRRFSEEFKARILKLSDNASVGEISSILRKEGLYSSHLQKWRAERAAGSLKAKKRGPQTNPLTAENRRLKLENERLQKKLHQQEMILDLQKKVSEILNITLPKLGE